MTQKFLVIEYSCGIVSNKWYISDNIMELKLYIIKREGYYNKHFISQYCIFIKINVQNDLTDIVDDYFEYIFTPGQGIQYDDPGKEWYGIKILTMDDEIKWKDISKKGIKKKDKESNDLIKIIQENLKK
jgi:hypothetical protein